jgi:tRNA A-37 threonylcarbamoyl transferase component Bud32
VTRIDWKGRPVWLKRPEVLTSLRWRLQKGDPQRAFRREVEGLRTLAGQGVPVPKVLDAGPDFLFLEDAGPTLDSLLDDPSQSPEVLRGAVTAAAQVLADLHSRGLAHGRPYLRDICWDGARATLIDFERFRARNSALRQGFDQVLFLASVLSRPAGAGHVDAAVAVLRAAAPAAAWRGAGVWIRIMRPFGPVARLVCRLRPHNREVAGYVRLLARWKDWRQPAA